MPPAGSAGKLLEKLGKAALQPLFANNVWHKPAITARGAARLRKEALEAGKPWPYEREVPKHKQPGLQKRLKGHKHDVLAAQRREQIKKNMEDMPNKIAQYRASRKLQEGSLLDQLLTPAKQRLLKQFRDPNIK